MKLLSVIFFFFLIVIKNIQVLGTWPTHHLPPCFHCVLVLSLSAPPLSTMKLLPSSFSKPAFPHVWAEIHPVHDGMFLLTYSRKLTENLGSVWSWRLSFLSEGSRGGCLQQFLLWGKFPLLLKGQFGCAQSNSRITRGSFGWPSGLAHGSVFWLCSCYLVYLCSCFTSGWDFMAKSGFSDKRATVDMPSPK